MQKAVLSRLPRRSWASFTLVELLTVMAIIAILAALVLYAAMGVMNKAARSRATAEVQAMSSALENYKTDNGAYPTASGLLTNTYSSSDPSTAGGLYQTSSQTLFQALSGLTNFTDTPIAGTKSYMPFQKKQIGSPTSSSYIQDPWNYSYGYSTGSTNSNPYNGSGFFDLWSTGGTIGGSSGTETNTAIWLKNWN